MLMPRYQPNNNNNNNNSNNNNTNNHHHHHHIGGPSTVTVAAHTKMRLLSKVESNMRHNQQHNNNQQHSPNNNNSSSNSNNHNHNQKHNQSVKKLITTAAIGNGVVGDVDGLLTPMRIKERTPNGSSGKELGKERNLWSRIEMLEMLTIMQQINAVELLNDRNVRSENVFLQIEEIMRSKGYVKKSGHQIWTKWKFLKSTYNTNKRLGTVPKVVHEDVYRVLCKMLGASRSSNGSSNNNSCDREGSSECGTSINSMDGMTELPPPPPAPELELEQEAEADVDDDSALGVEHPIFGYRLGPIKPEPVDTGYEQIVNYNNSASDDGGGGGLLNPRESSPVSPTLDHSPFVLSVKNEPEMELDIDMNGTNTPPPTAPASPSPPPPLPPLPPQLPMPQDYGELETQPSSEFKSLRVANFAKESEQRPSHGVFHIERPNVGGNATSSKQPLHRSMRAVPLQSTSHINFVHPTTKLMLPKLAPQSHHQKRTARENGGSSSSLDHQASRSTFTNTTGYTPRLKQVPMRQTGYSLRPGRMIPDLDQSISPPLSPSPMHSQPVPTLLTRALPYGMGGFGTPTAAAGAASATVTTTMNNRQSLQRKRHSMPDAYQSVPVPAPVPVKIQRVMAPSSTSSISMLPTLMSDTTTTTTTPHTQKLESFDSENKSHNRRQEQLFETELSELASAMHEMQKDMLEGFFAQQKTLAYREHQYQMKQDALIMRALRKQTDELLRTAHKLINEVNEPKPKPEQELEPEPEPEPENEITEDRKPCVPLEDSVGVNDNEVHDDVAPIIEPEFDEQLQRNDDHVAVASIPSEKSINDFAASPTAAEAAAAAAETTEIHAEETGATNNNVEEDRIEECEENVATEITGEVTSNESGDQ